MQTAHWHLLGLLADGRSHHIGALAQQLGQKPAQLNRAWRQMPAHVRGLLRQHDGWWRLVRPLAVQPENRWQAQAAAHGFAIAVLPECVSSNDQILALARQSPAAAHRQLCVTYQQSGGRGRQGRRWHSRSGECLMLSIGWCFDRPQAQLGALALVVALAVQRALSGLGATLAIKWPNDLVVGHDKLGGILIETVHRDGRTTAVIGLGLNFVLPKTVAQATSLQTQLPHITVGEVFDALLQQLAQMLPEFEQHGFSPFQAAYEAAHRDQQQWVHLLQQDQVVEEGRVLGIAADGALRLHTDAGEQQVVSGEISLRPGPAAAPPPPQSSSKYLLLDGGNSKLKWAWVEQGQIRHQGKAAYADLHTLAQDWQRHGDGTLRIVGSAVCGAAKQALVARQLPLPVEWLGSMPQALGIRNHYRNPAEHGADRWFNILGSRRYSQQACVVVSCGTAVTVDALTVDNHYLGGSILPGFHLMKEAMAERTANLNRPLGRAYPFATTTPNALASGITDAVCGALLLMHQRLRDRTPGGVVDVVVTGGGALRVVQGLPAQFGLDNRIEIVDNLVIYGLLNWVEQA